MWQLIFQAIDHKSMALCSVTLLFVWAGPLAAILGCVAALSTIAYNVIKIRQELKRKVNDTPQN